MKKKRVWVLILAMISVCFVTACSQKDSATEEKEKSIPSETISKEESSSQQEEKEQEELNETEQSYVQPEMKGEISVSVYQSEEWMEMAVQMFENKYPDMKVNIQDFYTGTDTFTAEGGGATLNPRPAGQTKEDYAIWLNTELMSGNAGDIVITSDGLPVGKYENMGVFEDLTPYLAGSGEITEDGYYMNIFDAYRTDSGALYQFPLSAKVSPLFMFNQGIVEETGLLQDTDGKSLTWREALTLAEEMYDSSSLSGKKMPQPRSFLGNIFTKEVIDSVDYVGKMVKLREKELLEILVAFDEFNKYDIHEFKPDTFEVFLLSYNEDISSARLVISGSDVATQWKYSDGKVHLSPYFAKDFGINSQSQNKALAWEFLKFLASDEVQTLPTFPYAGVNKNGVRARIETYSQVYQMPAEEIEEIVKLIDGWLVQVNGYRSEDTDLIQIGDAILQEFLDGSLTAEEAVAEVAFRLEQHLSE